MFNSKTLLRSLFVLVVLFVALATTDSMKPGRAEAACDPAVYDFCWSQGRNVNPQTCECNYQSCLGLPESDCTEQGGHLDYATCTCVFDPEYQGICDRDPYACGCPRSFGC